jgi:hypothetical protein
MTSQEEFWIWFVAHEPELFEFDPSRVADRERIFDELASEMQKIDPDLVFEFGPREPIREFVVSAGGVKRAFPAVVSTVAAVPELDRWKVTAFRPRRALDIVEFQAKRIDPREVQFSLLENGKMPGIYLFIPGFREKDTTLQQIGYLLLDEALGEYDVESRVGLIKLLSPETRTVGERYPLTDLPELFDRLISQLERRSGKSS